jgi:hypothetical protein
VKTAAALLSFAIIIAPAAAQDAMPDFSGAWKRDCAKTYGLKISRAADDRFAVTFCFPAGCNDHAWIAQTPIAGDPKFKVVSDSEIGLRRVDIPDAWLMYRRCSRDPASWDDANPK